MNADAHRRLRAIFDEALPLEASEREAFLNRACANDPELHSQVARLLAIHAAQESFLEQPLNLLSSASDTEQFAGTDRFRVVRQVGSGGMGVVYEVHDGLRDEVVALKTLRRTGPADLYRLKREFRSLADVTHPNLICLYELFVEDARSFFTMELVGGASFVDYVRGPARANLSVERLVPAFRQLVDGVSELHRRGKLHRDIKPSNVLVTPEGRVVILDFGLIAESTPLRTSGEFGGGTPAYMSPEETSGGAPSEASDWYGVGVTLYEALTGVLPFHGSLPDVLRRKTTMDPRPPAQLAPGDVPIDLSDICIGLLRREPIGRLTGPAASRLLFGAAAQPATSSETAPQETPFVGRRDELDALTQARDVVANGAARAVAIYGPSGIGKSALVRQFLSQLARDDEAVVLAGRCYENESVPYAALDGVVDDLSHYLGSSPLAQVEALVPRDIAALLRVFPVLLQVEAFARAPRDPELDRSDPLRVRRRAFEALGALLAQLAARRLLVIWIDDLQWADADSTVLLEELLSPPGRQAHPPAMLTLLCFRREEMAAKPFLQALLDRAPERQWSTVSLEPMSDAESRSLIGGLFPGESMLSDHDRQRMTREAGGSPFVLEQLALHAAASSGDAMPSPTFAGMFESRLGTLSAHARLFLETLAICGRPMSPDIVCEASGVVRERQSLIVMLRSARFIRSSGSSDRVETYHDRIREVLAERIAVESVRNIHGRMVASLVARHSDDCEALFEHYRGAGDSINASLQAALAAGKSGGALAFDRAAFFYRHALDLAPAAVDAHAWREALAGALANAGRPAEAADAYLQAATGAGHARRVELQRRAAEQFLTGGHIDRGLDLIRSVLESVGLSLPRGPRTAAVRLLWRRAQLRWRGLHFVSRQAGDIDPEALLRLDTCWATATGLALVDVISASDFCAQHLLMALDAGEPSRVARGMALESSARSADWTFRASAPRLAEESRSVAERVGTPQAQAFEVLADAISATAVGQWRRALTSSQQALTILQDRSVGLTWEMNIAQNMLIWSLMYLGEMGEVARLVPALLDDARRRGNLYLATELCTRSNIVWLARDDSDEGQREVDDVMARWSHKGFHRQHYSARLARVQTALYRGDSERAWRLFNQEESSFQRSMLTHVQAFRVESLYLQARTAIAVASTTRASRNRHLSVARRCARRVARERMPWSDPLASLLHGCLAWVEGDPAAAETHLRDAAERFGRAEMGMYAAIACSRLGGLLRNDRGRDFQRQADAWMTAQRIQNPVALTRMLAPGFPDRDRPNASH